MLKKIAQNFSVLYVEDDDELRESTASIFEDLFEELVVASNGAVGLSLYNERINKGKPYFDLVISDIQMPFMDGIALSKEILKINKKQKIVIVSAYSETEYFIELIKMGVASFIQKPISSAQLFDTLYEVCTSIYNEREESRYIELAQGFKWDNDFKILLQNGLEIPLTANETNLMDLFINNCNKKFTDLDIFNNIYYDDPEKEFSVDTIKSLLKRLRKKIPKDLIKNNPKLGYNLNK